MSCYHRQIGISKVIAHEQAYRRKLKIEKKNGIKKRNIIPFHPIYIIDIYNIYNIYIYKVKKKEKKKKKKKKSHAKFTNMAMKMENDTYFQIHDF